MISSGEFKRSRMQYVVYTVKDFETGETKEIWDRRPVREGLRKPTIDRKEGYGIVAAKVIGVF